MLNNFFNSINVLFPFLSLNNLFSICAAQAPKLHFIYNTSFNQNTLSNRYNYVKLLPHLKVECQEKGHMHNILQRLEK
jgi:hypothetical protein